jgi:hypothetical protein
MKYSEDVTGFLLPDETCVRVFAVSELCQNTIF